MQDPFYLQVGRCVSPESNHLQLCRIIWTTIAFRFVVSFLSVSQSVQSGVHFKAQAPITSLEHLVTFPQVQVVHTVPA